MNLAKVNARFLFAFYNWAPLVHASIKEVCVFTNCIKTI